MTIRRLVINGSTVADVHIKSKTIGFPPVKVVQVDVPGSNGVLDLSTALTGGRPRFGNRALSFDCTILATSSTATLWAEQKARGALWHGQVVTLTTDDEPTSYFQGRAALDGWTETAEGVGFTLKLDAAPYRFASTETTVTSVAGTAPGTDVTFDAGDMPVMPSVLSDVSGVIISDADGRTWVTTGVDETLPGLVVQGETTLTLVGSGNVTFTFRKGWL